LRLAHGLSDLGGDHRSQEVDIVAKDVGDPGNQGGPLCGSQPAEASPGVARCTDRTARLIGIG
jgi:hypothetical protein